MSPILEVLNGTGQKNRRQGGQTVVTVAEEGSPPLKTQLDEITHIMEEAGIEYWVDSGTLLGLVREGDFIEWDKDIDLGIWAEDLPRLRGLWSRFKELGYDPWPYCSGPPHVLSLVPKGKNDKIAVNIGGYRRHGDRSYRLVWGIRKNTHPHNEAKHWVNELYRFPLHVTVFVMRSRVGVRPLVGRWPWTHIIDAGYWDVPYGLLEKTKYHATGYRIPERAEEYLGLRYGDWRTPVKQWDYRRDDGAYRSGVPPCI